MRRSVAPGEGAALVAEHLALDEIARDRGAVHAHERLVAARAPVVDRGRDELLSRPRFAHHQHARIARRDRARSARARAAISALVPDHLAREPELLAQRLRFAAAPAAARARSECVRSIASCVSGFSRKWKAPSLVARTASRELGAPAHHHDRQCREALAQLAERRHAIELARHHEIEQHRVRLALRRPRARPPRRWPRRAR